MRLLDIEVGKFFYLDDIISYPKLRTKYGYSDLCSQIAISILEATKHQDEHGEFDCKLMNHIDVMNSLNASGAYIIATTKEVEDLRLEILENNYVR